MQPKTLTKSLRRCDVAIGAIRGRDRSPAVVTQQMVEQMKEGAVIVDVSIDRGGCFETSSVTTHSKPTFQNLGSFIIVFPTFQPVMPEQHPFLLVIFLLRIC